MKRRVLEGKASLSAIRRAIRGDLARRNVNPIEAFDCLVAVTETCANALLQGPDDPAATPPPEVAWKVDEQSGRFSIRDHSAGERHQKSPGETARDSGETYGGYGKSIVRKLMDEVHIDVAVDGTTVTLIKFFGSSAGSRLAPTRDR